MLLSCCARCNGAVWSRWPHCHSLGATGSSSICSVVILVHRDGMSLTIRTAPCLALRADRLGSWVVQFVKAVMVRWPNAVLQFEDFNMAAAEPLLERYRQYHAVFNDDIVSPHQYQNLTSSLISRQVCGFVQIACMLGPCRKSPLFKWLTSLLTCTGCGGGCSKAQPQQPWRGCTVP